MFHGQNSKGLKFYPRLNIWKNSKGTNYFNPETFEACSYEWWVYVKKIKGKVVFNDYNYSMSTCGHQSDMKGLLDKLGIKVDLYVHMEASLDCFERDSLYSLYAEMFQLKIELDRKGTRKAGRIERIAEIKKEISLYRSLGAKFSRDRQSALKKDLLERETERQERLAEERERRKAKGIKNQNPDEFLNQTDSFVLSI